MNEPSAFVPWSVLISIGATLITTMGGVIVALLSARLKKLEDNDEERGDELHKLRNDVIELQGKVAWLTASDGELKGSHVPREIVLQRLEQQDKQLERIERSLDRKASVGTMARINPHDARLEPDDESTSGLPPMRGRLPSRR